MDPAEIQAEIAALRRQIVVLRDRANELSKLLESPSVIPVLHYVCYGSHDEEALDWAPYTLQEAFQQLASGDEYGNYSAIGVSVGGCLVTIDEWRTDPRRPGGAEERARREQAAREQAEQEEVERIREVELAKLQRITRFGPMVALFSKGVQVTDWQRQDSSESIQVPVTAQVDELVVAMPDGNLARHPVTGFPNPGTDYRPQNWPLG